MNLYLITQPPIDQTAVYAPRSVLVAAESEDQARNTPPEMFTSRADGRAWLAAHGNHPEQRTVKLLGTAPAGTRPHVVIAV